MKTLKLSILAVAFACITTACGNGPTAVDVPLGGDVFAAGTLKAKADPTASPTATAPVPTPQNPVDSACPERMQPARWVTPLPGAVLHGKVTLRCALTPAVGLGYCVSQMGYVFDLGGGLASIGATEKGPSFKMEWDTTTHDNGPVRLYCFPIDFTGLGYAEPAPLDVVVAN